MCLAIATLTARASASPLLTPSPRAPRSRACLCDCADELSTHITPLQYGHHAQRLAPPPLTDALCASQSRPSRREPVHPHCSRRLHAHHAHARASVFALAHLPRASVLCGVVAAHSGWRHHRPRSRCVPHRRDPEWGNRLSFLRTVAPAADPVRLHVPVAPNLPTSPLRSLPPNQIPHYQRH